MKIKNQISKNLQVLFSISTVLTLFLFSCIKSYNTENFGASVTDLCTDNILNNGEYFTDCGGPCTPCATADPLVKFNADSTWLPKNPNNRVVSSDFVLVNYDSERIYISAVDTFFSKAQRIEIHFTINSAWGDGVHYTDSMVSGERYYHNPPFTAPGEVFLENGYISITNRDTVNYLISGNFEFNSKPSEVTGYRVAILNGYFQDVPYKP